MEHTVTLKLIRRDRSDSKARVNVNHVLKLLGSTPRHPVTTTSCYHDSELIFMLGPYNRNLDLEFHILFAQLILKLNHVDKILAHRERVSVP